MNITNSSVSFKGLYTLEGPISQVKELEETIDNKFKQDYKKTGKNKLNQYTGLYILPKEQEPATKLLVATNEDARPLVCFVGSNYKKYNFINYPKHDKPYKEARSEVSAHFRNNADDLLDIYSAQKKGVKYDAKTEAKTFLAHFAYEHDTRTSKIPNLEAEKVLKAIKAQCFDFINGVIKTVK